MTDCQSVFITRHGPPSVLQLQSSSLSDPRQHEVQVEIKYSGINFADIMSRIGIYTTRLKPPYILGMEIAGVVMKTGADEYNSILGKTVVGICKSGGYSTHVNVPAKQLFTIEEKWLSVAASIPVNYLTAYFMMLHQGSLKKDENLSKLVEQIFSKKLLTSPSGTFWSSDALDSINRDRLISRLRASSRNPKIFLDILLMEIIKSRNINILGIRAPMHIAYAVLLRRLYPSSKILFIIRA